MDATTTRVASVGDAFLATVEARGDAPAILDPDLNVAPEFHVADAAALLLGATPSAKYAAQIDALYTIAEAR
jgi:hypothetical protein